MMMLLLLLLFLSPSTNSKSPTDPWCLAFKTIKPSTNDPVCSKWFDMFFLSSSLHLSLPSLSIPVSHSVLCTLLFFITLVLSLDFLLEWKVKCKSLKKMLSTFKNRVFTIQARKQKVLLSAGDEGGWRIEKFTSEKYFNLNSWWIYWSLVSYGGVLIIWNITDQM